LCLYTADNTDHITVTEHLPAIVREIIKTENKGGNWQALIYIENADKIACDRVSVCTRACNNDA